MTCGPHTVLSMGLALGLASVVATPAPAADPGWADAIHGSVMLDAGITESSNNPRSHVNFGHLFTDRDDGPVLNQLMLTLNKDLDPKAPGWDWGFKAQAFYGSDARYTHFVGEFDSDIKDREQFDITEANLLLHAPVAATAGGIDIKLGQYTTPMGLEVIPANGNTFYSHSYIFNFGLPFKHTGVLTTTHLTSAVDLYLGADSGVDTGIGRSHDNNDAWAGLAGIGLTLMDGKLTVLGTTHIGPENPSSKAPLGVPGANGKLRTYSDLAVTYKASDSLTLMTELNHIWDAAFDATGYGAAQYAVYQYNTWLSLAGRAEIWRDEKGFFVLGFPGNRDADAALRGLPTAQPVLGTGRGTTYGALTLGATLKPQGMPKTFDGTMVRPEIRYDNALNNVKAYSDGRGVDQFTFGVDVVVPITFLGG